MKRVFDMGMTDILAENARTRPDHPAIEDLCAGRVVSYAEMPGLVDAAARNLLDLGIQAEDFVAVILPVSADHIIARLALEKIGTVIIPIRRTLLDAEKIDAIDDLDVKAAITNEKYRETTPPGPHRLMIDAVCAERTGRGATQSLPAIPMDDRPLLASRSSGTTGTPKRLLLSRKHIWHRSRIFMTRMGLTPQDRFLQTPGLDHVHGYELCRAMLSLGGTVIVGYELEVPGGYLTHFQRRNISLVCLSPSELLFLLHAMKDGEPRFPQLTVALTGEPVANELRALSCARLTSKVINWYGSSEVGGVSLATQQDHERVPDSVGRALDGVDVHVVDDSDRPLPPMEIGQIGYRASYFPTEYHHNPAATAKHFRGGWFYPGDFAMIDEDGNIFVMGRADDAINYMGENFYPFDTERVLRSHPAVVDAAVFGQMHRTYGEWPVAAVVVREYVSPEALDKFCEERLEALKRPQWIELVNELPKNVSGKVTKFKLKEIVRPPWAAN